MLQVFSGVRVAYLLLLLCIILVTLCSLLCMSVFHVWSLSLDYILFITAKTLAPFILLEHAPVVLLSKTLQ